MGDWQCASSSGGQVSPWVMRGLQFPVHHPCFCGVITSMRFSTCLERGDFPVSEVQIGWYSRYFLVSKSDGTLQDQKAHTSLAIAVGASQRLVHIHRSEGCIF